MALGSLLLLFVACSDRTAAEDDPIPADVRAYARNRCEKLEQCGCKITTDYDTREQCEAKLVQLYQDNLASRDVVDLECFGDAARLWERTLCDEPHDGVPCEATSQTDPIGAPCQSNPFHDVFLWANTCAEGSYCWNDERCVTIVSGIEEGMPCSPEGLCGNDLTCIGGRCEEHRTEGEPCESSSNCAPGREVYCDGEVCVPRKPEGAACTASGECGSGDACFDGQCTPVESLVCLVAQF